MVLAYALCLNGFIAFGMPVGFQKCAQGRDQGLTPLWVRTR
jgi:hypothetical protein